MFGSNKLKYSLLIEYITAVPCVGFKYIILLIYVIIRALFISWEKRMKGDPFNGKTLIILEDTNVFENITFTYIILNRNHLITTILGKKLIFLLFSISMFLLI